MLANHPFYSLHNSNNGIANRVFVLLYLLAIGVPLCPWFMKIEVEFSPLHLTLIVIITCKNGTMIFPRLLRYMSVCHIPINIFTGIHVPQKNVSFLNAWVAIGHTWCPYKYWCMTFACHCPIITVKGLHGPCLSSEHVKESNRPCGHYR